MIIKYKVKDRNEITDEKGNKVDIWFDREIDIPDETLDEVWFRVIMKYQKETE